MRVIGLGVLSAFCDEHADCRKWISNWIRDVKQSTWRTTHDIKLRYAAASFLAENVVIFNVRGNVYRLETQVAFGVGVVAIKWIGTHAEYDKRKI
ncbi:mRNA interferase HigB [Variovorax sp. YR634]|jgi:mRNA interferase HigB|uniref:type II toxin-antitoxin system HigB family toxin n=1 Tax=Variovorax sp. YR634 TaxID=1884385 RepID=UPI00089C6B57|nr:type II toxin-antitoxin system HigB family toxin [Variovorax sp. YR634]SDZ43202.1 mRNA interferase HigB [Variovorax sp. YR634]